MIELSNKDLSDENRKLSNALIYLVSCGVNKVIPDESKIAGINLKSLYNLAKRHSLQSLCCMALESSNVLNNCDKELKKLWQVEKDKVIRKNIMLDGERSKIFKYMEQEGIWHMPLKGVILKEYYPKLGMRQMADNDILYDAAYQKKLKIYMKSQGYTAESVGKGNHDVYLKEPIYNFEMHTALFGSSSGEIMEEYYRNIKKRLIKDKNLSYEYYFREEDFYIYILSHTYKHFNGGGTGLRSLVDIYVYLKKMKEKLNWHYIETELEMLRLTEFEQETRELSKKLFVIKEEKLNNFEQKNVLYYLGSGTYGTVKNKVSKSLRKAQPGDEKIKKSTKFKYYVGRVIPNMDYYRKYHPFLYKNKWLIPLFVPYRLIRGITKKGKSTLNEIKTVKKMDK